jgi:hypothetical protein
MAVNRLGLLAAKGKTGIEQTYKPTVEANTAAAKIEKLSKFRIVQQ